MQGLLDLSMDENLVEEIMDFLMDGRRDVYNNKKQIRSALSDCWKFV